MQNQSTARTAAQQQFVAMLPDIERVGRFYFRHRSNRDEQIQEAVALAWRAFLRCLDNGNERCTARTLARYACRQVQVGRCVQAAPGHSVTDERGRRHGLTRVELDDYVDDRDNPAEVVPFKVDVPQWLASLPAILRRTADALIEAGPNALGFEIARQLGVSAGRLSQRRRLLLKSWLAFTS